MSKSSGMPGGLLSNKAKRNKPKAVPARRPNHHLRDIHKPNVPRSPAAAAMAPGGIPPLSSVSTLLRA